MSEPLNWKLIGVFASAGLLTLGGGAWWLTQHNPPIQYATATVTRGDVVTSITASGSVNPVVTVQVGTYVSGTIQALMCDYNTRVHKGQLCAKIDPAPYQIVVEQNKAELDNAKAQLVKDQANVVYTRLAKERAALLFKQDSGSRDAADTSLNAFRQALAQVELDTASIAQRIAALRAAQINLNYTNIVSPVDGTVVSRNVTIGQTVAASFQTPTLFLIANDLSRMQVDTNVSESDIAGAKEGAEASFTVDAYPNRVFHGQVTQVRQAPVSIQNVITYDVVVTVANPDFALKPGMTATAQIIKAKATNALRIPSGALRFTPVSTGYRAPAKSGAPSARQLDQRRVFVLRDSKLVAVPVIVGLDDGTNVEIRSGGLHPGDQVVTGELTKGAAAKSSTAAPSLRL